VFDGVTEGVLVEVAVGVNNVVAVGDDVKVFVGVFVGVCVKVGVTVLVGVTLGVELEVLVGLAVTLGVAVGHIPQELQMSENIFDVCTSYGRSKTKSPMTQH